MTQRDFNRIAWELAHVRPEPGCPDEVVRRAQWGECVLAMMAACQDSNPRFKREKFMDACYNWAAVIRDGERVYR